MIPLKVSNEVSCSRDVRNLRNNIGYAIKSGKFKRFALTIISFKALDEF